MGFYTASYGKYYGSLIFSYKTDGINFRDALL